jgi:hypothetical protein
MTTTIAAPEWLTKRDGSLKPGIREGVLFVMIGGKPLYRLDVRPAGGKFVCAVVQTVNGKQIGDATSYATSDAALSGGLEQLRNNIGW